MGTLESEIEKSEKESKPRRVRLTNGLVAFVDMLGFSQRVENLRKGSNEVGLLKIEQDVEFVQEAFDHRSVDQTIRQVQKITGKKVLAFSDCVVVSVPLRSSLTRSEGTFDILVSELYSLALAQAKCVMRQTFLRGGVDLGLWYRNQDTLISPAMVRSYKLEQEVSVPVIAITDKLSEFLENHPERNFYLPDEDPLRKMLRSDPQLPGDKQYRYLDYLKLFLDALDGSIKRENRDLYRLASQEGREIMRTEAWETECREVARLHGQHISNAFHVATDIRIKRKYAWLVAYHNKCIEEFFHDERSQFIITI